MVESQAVGRRTQAKGASLSAGVASAPCPPPDPAGHTEDNGTVLSLWGFDALCSVAICFFVFKRGTTVYCRGETMDLTCLVITCV